MVFLEGSKAAGSGGGIPSQRNNQFIYPKTGEHVIDIRFSTRTLGDDAEEDERWEYR
jgi:hypothetical protein